ncbi:hypothetical protein V2G26_011825 [Clonostachys chloroleuca]
MVDNDLMTCMTSPGPSNCPANSFQALYHAIFQYEVCILIFPDTRRDNASGVNNHKRVPMLTCSRSGWHEGAIIECDRRCFNISFPARVAVVFFDVFAHPFRRQQPRTLLIGQLPAPERFGRCRSRFGSPSLSDNSTCKAGERKQIDRSYRLSHDSGGAV